MAGFQLYATDVDFNAIDMQALIAWRPNQGDFIFEMADPSYEVVNNMADQVERDRMPWNQSVIQYVGEMWGTSPENFAAILARDPADSFPGGIPEHLSDAADNISYPRHTQIVGRSDCIQWSGLLSNNRIYSSDAQPEVPGLTPSVRTAESIFERSVGVDEWLSSWWHNLRATDDARIEIITSANGSIWVRFSREHERRKVYEYVFVQYEGGDIFGDPLQSISIVKNKSTQILIMRRTLLCNNNHYLKLPCDPEGILSIYDSFSIDQNIHVVDMANIGFGSNLQQDSRRHDQSPRGGLDTNTNDTTALLFGSIRW